MDGIILIDKEKNYTSRDIVNIISKKLKIKKIGHFGTLDPLATGLLVIGVGKYTKFQSVLDNENKEYEVEVYIGKSTDTYDITGNVIEEKDVIVDKDVIVSTLLSLKKKYLQEVPIYSSVKVNGRKLYEYARNNETVELPQKEIEIFSISDIKLDKNILKFRCLVSKGTYVRSLINDLSKKLNIPMCMNNLRRLKCGVFDIKDASKIDDFKFFDIFGILNYKRIEILEELKNKITNGNKIDDIYNEKRIIFTKDNKNVVLYEKEDTTMYPKFFF